MELGEAPNEGSSGGLARHSASPEPNSQVQRKILVRSCITCHQRKVRCDKRSPCTNCVRADVLCCYPTPQRNHVRPHRMTIADVAARVARLERTVKAIEGNTLTSSTSPLNGSGPLSTDNNDGQGMLTEGYSPSPELLLQDGTKSEYFNEFMISRVLAEEEELRSILGSYDPSENQVQESMPMNVTSILLGSSDTADSKVYQPTRWHALQLWQTYLNNVEPLLKVFHTPTIQIDIYRAINTNNDVPEDLKSLLFSVYFAATTSLSAADAGNLLGMPRATALENYKRGLEHSLHKSDVFNLPNMRTLQALTIYLTCLRVYDCGRAAWVLNGLVHRLAKSIGLHRDGKNFGLSPFESEMRRRLWYRIYYWDVRAAEDLGISLIEIDTSSDAAFPLNVNDSQISPDMKSLPASETGWTDMTLALIKIETACMVQRVIQGAASSLIPMPSHYSRADILREHISRLENAYMAHCDENIPIQRATLASGKLVIEKLKFLLRHQQSLDEAESHSSTIVNEESLEIACTILEGNLQVLSDELLRGYRWYLGAYVQYHILTYVLWHLCIKPDSPNYIRALRAVDDTLQCDYRPNSSTRWKMLLQLRAKAIRQREVVNMKGTGTIEIPPTASTLTEDAEEAGGISHWEFNNFNETFGWENIVDELYAQI
ncbi:fungal-specific transcription factor domain-containing protein [Xylogone sp. PMI_703]|nr:fungal-specific transcription factor domain-containing protein [Xylogone sp. PMI_703]